MRHVNLLIKPASGACNLRCKYCFYHDLMTVDERAASVMAEAVMETLVRRAMAEAEESVSFAFQGGEPTLAGLDFFRRFTGLVRAENRRGVRVHYAIQTNGLVLDAAWAEFLRENRFLVGLSMDGDAARHDALRVDPEGRGTHKRVLEAMNLLKNGGVEYNILCVVTGGAARHPQRLYGYFKRQGCRYLQFIPCLDPWEAERGEAGYSLTPARYGEFLKGLFDLWKADYRRGEYVSIRLFDDWVHILAGMPPGTCATAGQCGSYVVVESDGSAYPCDFYVLEQWRLGNIRESSFEELMGSPLARQFLMESARMPERCAGCGYYGVCRGGCKRDRLFSPEGAALSNYHCEAFKAFFDYALPRMRSIAARERSFMGRQA